MPSTDVDYIRERIGGYTDRGTFAGCREQSLRGGTVAFTFRWLLGADFELRVHPKKGELLCVDLLPQVPQRSHLDREIRRYIASRTDAQLPAHRRMDPDKVGLKFRNRAGNGTLSMSLRVEDSAYALKALFILLNDLFAWLQLYHIDYLQQNFGLPEE